MSKQYGRIGFTALFVLVLLLATTGVALAFDYQSGDHVNTMDANTLAWTGQGATDGVLGTEMCPSPDVVPQGIDENNYLLWIFTTDGGSADGVSLTLGGTGSGTYLSDKDSGNTFHIFTPYFTPDPTTLTAVVSFNTLTLGNGTWNLVISHGCEGFVADITTVIHSAAEAEVTEVDLGSTVHDSATVTGTGPMPTGLVDFYFYGKDLACVDGEGIGNGVAAGVVALDSLGVAHPSDSEGPLEAGSYNFKAYYEGDTNYAGIWGDCEPLTVKKGDTDTTTEVQNVNSDLETYVGNSVYDTATVVGDPTEPFTITGTVTYELHNGLDCLGDLVTQDLNDADITNPETVDVGTDSTPVVLPVGDYGYLVSYSGDDNYNGSDAVCEPLHILPRPTVTTTEVHDPAHNPITSIAPGIAVHDKAFVVGNPGLITLPITGDVTYSLYSSYDCTGTKYQLDETVPVGSESSPIVLPMGLYSYKASFVSTTVNYTDSVGACEPFAVYKARLTPGYWKNHQAQTTALLPIRLGNYVFNSINYYFVNTFPKATAVFNAMNCGNASSNSQNAVGCLAGHLLAAKLNVKNGTNPCATITTAIDNADLFLTNIHYIGPSGTYSLNAAKRSQAITIKNTLDSYNNGGVCP